MPEGVGVWKDSVGLYDGTFFEGEFVNGTIKYTDGSFYKGEMKDGKKNGKNAEFRMQDGDKFTGEFIDDNFYRGIYEGKDGSCYEGPFSQNIKQGIGRLILKDKLIYEG